MKIFNLGALENGTLSELTFSNSSSLNDINPYKRERYLRTAIERCALAESPYSENMTLLTELLNSNNTAIQLNGLPNNIQTILQNISNEDTAHEVERLSFILNKWNDSERSRNSWKVARATIVGVASVGGFIITILMAVDIIG